MQVILQVMHTAEFMRSARHSLRGIIKVSNMVFNHLPDFVALVCCVIRSTSAKTTFEESEDSIRSLFCNSDHLFKNRGPRGIDLLICMTPAESAHHF